MVLPSKILSPSNWFSHNFVLLLGMKTVGKWTQYYLWDVLEVQVWKISLVNCPWVVNFHSFTLICQQVVNFASKSGFELVLRKGIFPSFPYLWNWKGFLSNFLSKNSTLISQENCRFFGVKNSWKCCGFALFSCWQLCFPDKIVKFGQN